MTRLFADACYWVALINREDELHGAALAAHATTKDAVMYTTDEVLCEVLNHFCKRGPFWREQAVQMLDGIRADPRVIVNEQSRGTFDAGVSLYRSRLDHQYSLQDCISFEAMRHHGITDALTHDRHFEQEQFVALLRQHQSRA